MKLDSIECILYLACTIYCFVSFQELFCKYLAVCKGCACRVSHTLSVMQMIQQTPMNKKGSKGGHGSGTHQESHTVICHLLSLPLRRPCGENCCQVQSSETACRTKKASFSSKYSNTRGHHYQQILDTLNPNPFERKKRMTKNCFHKSLDQQHCYFCQGFAIFFIKQSMQFGGNGWISSRLISYLHVCFDVNLWPVSFQIQYQ